jgi:hypothetical protein
MVRGLQRPPRSAHVGPFGANLEQRDGANRDEGASCIDQRGEPIGDAQAHDAEPGVAQAGGIGNEHSKPAKHLRYAR